MERKITYDTNKYHFREIITNHLGHTLNLLHEIKDYPLFDRKHDQSSVFHKKFYEIGQEYFDTYYNFLKEVIKPLYQDKIVYQKIPTFRVHLNGNVAVGEFHRDRDYNHGRNELNYWLPFTNAWDSNTIWIESEEGKKDYKSYAVNYGEVLIFDGANLEHGNIANTTGQTRASVDFRVIPFEDFVPNKKTSINTKVSFDIGGYFEVL